MRIFLRAARLIDGIAAEALRDPLVVIEGERLLYVGPAASPAPRPVEGVDTLVEVADGTILPGFIETHTHMHCSGGPQALQDVLTDSDEIALLRASVSMRELVTSGVTTARDIGSKNLVAFTVREAIRRGVILGPDLLVSGAPITTTGGHFYFMGGEADSVEEVIERFRYQIRQGADFVKMMVSGGGFTPGTNMRRSQYRTEHVRAAADEARRLHRRLVAHCHATEAIAQAADAGVSNIIHCSWMTEDGHALNDKALAQIIDRGIYIDPTLAVGYRPIERALATGGAVDPTLQAMLESRAWRVQTFRTMHERGARFIAGTDSGMTNTPFGDWALTLGLFVRELGFTPMEAIHAGTSVAAEAVGLLSDRGTLAPGKRADAVIVRGDPLAGIDALAAVECVVLGGRIVKREGAMLA